MSVSHDPPGMSQQARQDWVRLVNEFGGESDRAAALVGAALLDDNLEHLLRVYLVDDEYQVERMLGTGLRTLGARIRACYCLGLISRAERRDLACIQSIRNYFAHNLHVSFDDRGVKNSCQDLKMIEPLLTEDHLDLRTRFERTVCMLSMLLVHRQAEAENSRLRIRPDLGPDAISTRCPLTES